jgi:hypothetical protein
MVSGAQCLDHPCGLMGDDSDRRDARRGNRICRWRWPNVVDRLEPVVVARRLSVRGVGIDCRLSAPSPGFPITRTCAPKSAAHTREAAHLCSCAAAGVLRSEPCRNSPTGYWSASLAARMPCGPRSESYIHTWRCCRGSSRCSWRQMWSPQGITTFSTSRAASCWWPPPSSPHGCGVASPSAGATSNPGNRCTCR